MVWVPRAGEDAQEVARRMASVIGTRIGWKDMETDVVWPGRSMDRIDWSGAEPGPECGPQLREPIPRPGEAGIGETRPGGRDDPEGGPLRVNRTASPLGGKDPDHRNRGPRREDPSVPAETLSERLSVDSEQPPQIIKDPIEAMDTASIWPARRAASST